MRGSNNACAACGGIEDSYYNHVHRVISLPRQQSGDDMTRIRGFAVDIGPAASWIFFRDKEPALVFGRAGRMSCYQITEYGVLPAVHEHRIYEGIRTLYVGRNSIDRQADEMESFQRWLQGVDLRSAYFQPPK